MSDPSQISSAAVDRENPWPGLASFTEDQRGFFHGRDEEITDLTQLAERRPLVVLFGQSGLGKSSILQAGVFPRLRADGFWPIYIRLDHGEGAPAPSEQVKDMVRTETAKAGTWTKPGIAKPGETLWEFFHHRDDRLVDRDGIGVVPVLVFDQFEELFTLGAARGERRDRAVAFIKELAELVENRPSAKLVSRLDTSAEEMEAFDFSRTDYRVIISLREDFLPDLESLKTIMPALMQKRMRLARMTGKQALEAVLKPGAGLVDADVARAIVEFVAGARGGSAEGLEELHVEPALLSVVCRELNERRRANGQPKITREQVSGDRREILTDFYERSVADLPEGMRAFVEEKLLTKSGYRDNLALETVLEEPGVTRELIDTLVARRLVRIEDRLGVQRVELTHDVLAEVIRASRDTRQQRLAMEQVEQQRRLEQAAAAQRARRQRFIIAGLGAAVVALLIGAFFGIRAQRRAEQAARNEAAQSSRTDFILGSRLLDENKTPEGLAYLVRAAKSDRTNHSIGPRLLSALAYRSFAEPVGKPIVDSGPIRNARYLNERRIATGSPSSDRKWGYYDLESGQRLRTFDFGMFLGMGGVPVDRFSAGGRLCAVVAENWSVEIWELESGRRLFDPLPHEQRVLYVAFSADDRWFLTSSADETVRVWDLGSGKLKTTVPYPLPGFGVVAISPDSTRFVTTGGGIRIWRLPDGTPLTDQLSLAPSPNPNALGNFAQFAPDGKHILVVSGGGVQLYDGISGAPVGPRLPQGGQNTHARFSHDSTKVATQSTDSGVRLWEVPSGKSLGPPLQHGADVTNVRFTADDVHLVTRSGDGYIRMWHVATGQLALEPIKGDAFGGDIHPSRSEILTGSPDGTLRRWQITPSAARPMEIPADRHRIAIERNAAGSPTAWAIYPARMQKMDLLTGASIGSPIEFPTTIKGAVLAPNEQRLMVATAAGDLELWQLEGTKIHQHALGPAQNIANLRFSPDSSFVARGGATSGLTVWDAKTAEVLIGPRADLGLARPRFLFPYSATSRYLVAENATANIDSVAIVDLKLRKAGNPIRNGGNVWAIALSPDERQVALGNSTGLVQIWDIATNQPVGEPFVPRRNIIRGVSFDRSGRRLLSWNRLEVYLWDVATRKRLLPVMPAGTDVITAIFSPDESRIASFATTRGEMRVFDAATGAMLGEPILGAHSTTAVPVTFTADGRFIVTSTPPAPDAPPARATTGLYLWPVPPASNGQPLPDWLLRLATAVAGGELDRNGTLQEGKSGADMFQGTRTELASLPPDAPYAEWGRWLLADRATRPIGPGLKITAAELSKQRAAGTAATTTGN
jgi:WD40 repeat protein